MKKKIGFIIFVFILTSFIVPAVTFADIIVAPPDRLPPEDGGPVLNPPDALPENEAPNPEPTPVSSGVCIDPLTTQPTSHSTQSACEAAGFTWEGEKKLDGLVQCGRKTIEVTKNGITSIIADPNDACNFNEFMHLINNIISFILFGLAIPIAGIMFAYAGFTLLTSGGSSSAKTKAKEIFSSAAIGLVISFVAYLIVVFVLKTLGYDGSWIFKTF